MIKRAATFIVGGMLLGGCASHLEDRRPDSPATGVTGIVGDSVDPLRAAREKPAVLIFVRTDCPVSNRYAPEIERLYRSYSPRGIIFWLVYPDPDTKLAEIKQHLQEYGLDVPTLRDPKHTLVRASGVSVTPEVAVLIPPASKLVYRGRIDDRMADFGKERPQARERDLEQVLEEIVSGKTVAPRTTRAIGCYISDFD